MTKRKNEWQADESFSGSTIYTHDIGGVLRASVQRFPDGWRAWLSGVSGGRWLTRRFEDMEAAQAAIDAHAHKALKAAIAELEEVSAQLKQRSRNDTR